MVNNSISKGIDAGLEKGYSEKRKSILKAALIAIVVLALLAAIFWAVNNIKIPAKIEENINNCNLIQNISKQEECIKGVAKIAAENNSLDICKINEQCYIEYAKLTKNTSVCDLLVKDYYPNRCYFEMAMNTKSIELCKKINNSLINECSIKLAELLNNALICEDIKNETFKKDCGMQMLDMLEESIIPCRNKYENASLAAKCMYDSINIDITGMSFSKFLNLPIASGDSKYRADTSNFGLALESENLSFCERLQDLTLKQSCKAGISRTESACSVLDGDSNKICTALAKRDESSCNLIIDENIKFTCKIWIIFINNKRLV